MNRKITTKNWQKRVTFHINVLKHLSSYKNFKKPKKFKRLIWVKKKERKKYEKYN